MIFKQGAQKHHSLSLSDLLQSMQTSPSVHLLSTESLHFQYVNPTHNISITSEECMKSRTIDKQVMLDALREKAIIHVLKIFEKETKRKTLNDWRKKAKGNVYLKEYLQNMITGVVRLGIILERKRRLIRHKAFFEMKNTEKKHENNRHSLQQLQPVLSSANNDNTLLLTEKHQNNKLFYKQEENFTWIHLSKLLEIVICSQKKQYFSHLTDAFEYIREKSKYSKMNSQNSKALIQILSFHHKNKLLEGLNNLKQNNRQYEQIDILVKSISFVHKIIKGHFYLNAWNTIKKTQEGFIKKDLSSKNKIHQMQQLQTLHNISSKLLCQKIEMRCEAISIKSNFNFENIENENNQKQLTVAKPLAFQSIKRINSDKQLNLEQQPIHLNSPGPFYKQKLLDKVDLNFFIENHKDISDQIIIQSPVKNPKKKTVISQTPSQKLSPKHSSKSSAFQLLQAKSKAVNKIKSSTSKLLPKTSKSPPVPNLLIQQVHIVNEYFISNHQYIPTFKRTIKSPEPIKITSPTQRLKEFSLKKLKTVNSPKRVKF